ncbi:MAG: hypothetical protein JKP98_25005 [Rhodobacteraceae bacterium]|nr:hypothetical protein [Paracoccaceae bacterium]
MRRAERATLLAAWQAERDRLGLEEVTEVAAGLRLTLPLGLVRRIGAEPPFIRYEGPDGVTVLLLSQPGDSLTLQAFFDIFQDLAVLPPDGPRTIGENAFRIEGRDGKWRRSRMPKSPAIGSRDMWSPGRAASIRRWRG